MIKFSVFSKLVITDTDMDRLEGTVQNFLDLHKVIDVKNNISSCSMSGRLSSTIEHIVIYTVTYEV